MFDTINGSNEGQRTKKRRIEKKQQNNRWKSNHIINYNKCEWTTIECQRKKKKKQKNTRKMWDKVNKPNKCVIGVPEEAETE